MVLAKELVDKLKKIEDFDITYESSDKDSGEIYIDYNSPRTLYIRGQVLPFWRTITYKGKESASMGWWGMTSDDKEEDVWNKEFKEYLDSVGDDVEISVIDFHI